MIIEISSENSKGNFIKIVQCKVGGKFHTSNKAQTRKVYQKSTRTWICFDGNLGEYVFFPTALGKPKHFVVVGFFQASSTSKSVGEVSFFLPGKYRQRLAQSSGVSSSRWRCLFRIDFWHWNYHNLLSCCIFTYHENGI